MVDRNNLRLKLIELCFNHTAEIQHVLEKVSAFEDYILDADNEIKEDAAEPKRRGRPPKSL